MSMVPAFSVCDSDLAYGRKMHRICLPQRYKTGTAVVLETICHCMCCKKDIHTHFLGFFDSLLFFDSVIQCCQGMKNSRSTYTAKEGYQCRQ